MVWDLIDTKNAKFRHHDACCQAKFWKEICKWQLVIIDSKGNFSIRDFGIRRYYWHSCDIYMLQTIFQLKTCWNLNKPELQECHLDNWSSQEVN